VSSTLGSDDNPYLVFESVNAKGGRATLHVFGKRLAVATWRDVLENTVNEVIEVDPDAYVALSRELSSHIGSDRTRFRDSRQLRNGGYVDVNLSAEGIDRLCRRILDVAGVSDTEWELERK
jgi:hypothetical protein